MSERKGKGDAGITREIKRELRRARELSEKVLNNSNNIIFAFDRDLDVTLWNMPAERITGIARSEALKRPVSTVDCFFDLTGGEESYLRVLDGESVRLPERRFFIDSLDVEAVLDVFLTPLRDDAGGVEGGLGIIHDITRYKRAEEELKASEEMLHEAQRLAHVGSWSWDVVRGESSWSDEMFRIAGREPQSFQITLESMLGVVHPEDHTQMHALTKRILETGDGFFAELRIRRPDGSVRVVESRGEAVRAADGRVIAVRGTWLDITERKRTEERTLHLAQHDPLTDLPNRRLLLELLDAALRSAQRAHGKIALLFLDLDRFKSVNDTLGHEAGDALLKEVADRLSDRVRRSDIVARLGGDEFTVLLNVLERGETAAEVAEEILRMFRAPFELNGQLLYVTTSIGISLFPDDSEAAEGLLRCADLAMYEAKEQGRNAYRFFNPAIDHRSRERVSIESRLRRALEYNQLKVAYQAQIDLHSGRMIGVEALVRWHDAQLGTLEPERFIPVAEETDLIIALDDWMLRTTCEQAREWLDQGLPPIRLSVNISARRFESPGFVETIGRNLAQAGLLPESLELELTERVVMHRVEQSVARMRELVSMGVCVAIDDFGTGYSSLNYLKRLPISRLKIDQSFVHDIAIDADDRAIVRAVTALAHTLNKRVIAEGVETQAQREFLLSTGCDEAQGFLFQHPLPPDEFARLLTH